jgi:carboxypeptidase Taq
MNDAYARLQARFAKIATCNALGELLTWDSETNIPPGPKASHARGEQNALISGLAHDLMDVSVSMFDLHAACSDETLPRKDVRNLELMHESLVGATAIPKDLVEAYARITTKCEAAWLEAKPASDFSMVEGMLEELVNLAHEEAIILGETFGMEPYDALMNSFQPDLTAAQVAPVLEAYRVWALQNVPIAEELSTRRGAIKPPPEITVAEQIVETRKLAEHMGLDFQHARMDQSVHPFCAGHSGDVRVTALYKPRDPANGVRSTLHEVGHALYESGLPDDTQPVGQQAGMVVHESQSLTWEKQVGGHPGFQGWLSRNLYGGRLRPEHFYTPVQRSLIRIEADEMTYPLHVLLRFNLEKALFAGDLKVADLPGAWNDGMRDLLGVEVPCDREGVLQDTHWYCGLFGYFPSYSIGAILAAQLVATMRRHYPGFDQDMEDGELRPTLHHMRTRIHQQGSLLKFPDLVQSATGQALDAKFFIDHLTRRYLPA